MSAIDRRKRFTKNGDTGGLECGPTGISLAGVPLLAPSALGLVPRRTTDIVTLIKSACGYELRSESLANGLKVAAEALNRGDLGRAMIAAVQLRLPHLDENQALRLIQANDILSKFDPDQPRDWHGRWTSIGTAGPDESGENATGDAPSPSDETIKPTTWSGPTEPSNAPAPSNADAKPNATPHPVSPDTIDPAAYMGRYHDIVVNDYATYLRSKGEIVVTSARFQMADGSGSAILDIIAKDTKTGLLYGVEVKTGSNPGFTPSQLMIYPHMMWGWSVVATDVKVLDLGIIPEVILPPIPIFLYYQRSFFEGIDINPLNPSNMSRYYRGERL